MIFVSSKIASVTMNLPFLSAMILSMVTGSLGLNSVITPRLWVEPWLAKIWPPHSLSQNLIVCVEEYVSWRKLHQNFVDAESCLRLEDMFNPLTFRVVTLSDIYTIIQ